MSKQRATRSMPAESWELFPDVPPLFDARLSHLVNGLLTPSSATMVYVPGADLVESDAQFTLDIDLPGVAKKDIVIEVTGRRVSVTGIRPTPDRDGSLRRSTRVSGSFAYTVMLPNAVDEKHVTAKLDRGVLHIALPKSTDVRSTQITVD